MKMGLVLILTFFDFYEQTPWTDKLIREIWKWGICVTHKV